MNCKDFREIADSYLSDELLVETNHDVFRHLEQCSDCRQVLSSRRELRGQLFRAVRNNDGSHIDHAFAAGLKTRLKNQAGGARRLRWLISPAFATVAAVFLVTFGLVGWHYFNRRSEVALNPNIPRPSNTKPDTGSLPIEDVSFMQIRDDAIADHKTCGLSFSLDQMPLSLEEASEKSEKSYEGMDGCVIKPLAEAFGDQVKVLGAHTCKVNGRRFAHVVLKFQDRIVSVLVTPREEFGPGGDSDTVFCQLSEGLRVACFETATNCVFVVSDLGEPDNMKIARIISSEVSKHLEHI